MSLPEFDLSAVLFEKFRKKRVPCTGMSLHKSPKGGNFKFVRLHYSGDPSLTPEKIKAMKADFTSLAYWKREMEIDADALGGALVFPEYDESIHVVDDEDVPRVGSLYCCIDPHPRVPHAYLWILVDRWGDYYVYREYWPSKVYGVYRTMRDDEEEAKYIIRDYADMCAQLEGNHIEFSGRPGSPNERGKYVKLPGGERIVRRYMDYAAKGFTASSDNKHEENYADRYARYGIPCMDPLKSHTAGEDKIHDLLKPVWCEGKGEWPRLHIARSVVELRCELRNHKWLPTRGKAGEQEISQREAGFRTHMIDNLRYLVTANLRYSSANESARCLVPVFMRGR